MTSTRMSLTPVNRFLLPALLLGTAPAWADELHRPSPESITVIGHRLPVTAISASEGRVIREQLRARPVLRPAELLEFVPGMIATQHSGEGKANQYFLRGFNLDHGTDFATWVDGMPVNLRSHAHGQGYTDINFLIPETIDSLVYRKGPFYADVGDFSAAGSADFRLRRELDGSSLTLGGGEHGYARLLAMGAPELAGGRLLLAADATRNQGPWRLDQDLEALKWLGRYSQGSQEDGFAVSVMAYDNRWTATDQIPARAVRRGDLDRLGFVDPSVGGNSSRYSLSFNRQSPLEDGHWALSAYAIDYALQLYSNFTYFLEDPNAGDQFEQFDERQVFGLAAHQERNLSERITLKYGLELRHDAISDLGLFRTQNRARLATIRRDRVDQSSAGGWIELRLAPHPRWQLAAGLRADLYRFEVLARRPENSGSTDDALLAPKFGARFAASEAIELFANVGRGFHSNDARGTVIRVDPASPTLEAVNPVEPLVAADALDLGLVWRLGRLAQLSMTFWALRLDSELVYVGDGGATEASDASRRHGIELAAYLTPSPWLILDLDYARSQARLDISAAARRIPNAVESAASIGLTLRPWQRWSGGLRLRHLGPAPLIEDNSQRSEPTTILNLEVGYEATEALALSLGVFNLLDSRDNDISYFYESRLPGEAAQGVADLHFHPVEPRQIRASLRWQWP